MGKQEETNGTHPQGTAKDRGEEQQQEGKATPSSTPVEGKGESLDSMSQERDAYKDRLLRLAAEYENYKKRVARDVEDAKFQTKEKFLREFLSVMDNLDRALLSVESSGSDVSSSQKVLVEGVKLVQRQFLLALEKNGITPLDVPVGQPFDPNLQEAVEQVERKGLVAGTVAGVLQRGYMAGTRLLRPALVQVVRPS